MKKNIGLTPIKKRDYDSDSDESKSYISDISYQESEAEESVKSETYQISFPNDRAVHPIVSNSLIEVDDKLNCTMRIGSGRPAGGVKNDSGEYVQGRHISAYAMIMEMIKGRLEGRNPKDSVQIIKTLLKEYIEENADLKDFFEEIDKIEEKYGTKQEDYELRVATYELVSASKEFAAIAKKDIDEIKKNNPESKTVECFERMKQAKDKMGAFEAIDVRNMIKRAQEAYSPLVSDLITMTAIIFNRVDDNAKDFGEGSGRGESGAISRLLNGRSDYLDIDKNLSPRLVAIDMEHLFDYNYKLSKRYEDVEDHERRRNLYCAISRHIKMTYDTFPLVKEIIDAGGDNKKHLLTSFCQKVLLDHGWEECENDNFKSADSLYKRIFEYDDLSDTIKFENGKAIIGNKSKVRPQHRSTFDRLDNSRSGDVPNTSISGIDLDVKNLIMSSRSSSSESSEIG